MTPEDPPGSGGWTARIEPLAARAGAGLLRARRAVRVALDRLLPRLGRGEHIFTIVTAMVIGVLGGYGAIVFRGLIALAHHAFFGTGEYSVALLTGLPWWNRSCCPPPAGCWSV